VSGWFWKIFLGVLISQKISVFSGQTIQKFQDLDPSPYVLKLRIILFSFKTNVTCIYLFPVHLDMILPVVSDKLSMAVMPWWSSVWTVPLKPPPAPPAQPCSPATRSSPQRPTFLWTLGGNIEFSVLARKKSWLQNEGSWQVPSRGTTTRMGRERELRERDSSHKRSWNHSRQLRERTPLQNCDSKGVTNERQRVPWIKNYLQIEWDKMKH